MNLRSHVLVDLRRSLFVTLGLSLAAAAGAGCTTTVSEADGEGGGGGTGGGTGNSSTGGTTTSATTCAGAVTVNQTNGNDSGFVQCPDNTFEKVGSVTCGTEVPGQTCAGTEVDQYCTTDADCTDRPNGQCMHQDPGPWDPTNNDSCGCVYPCADDSQCEADSVCVCAGVAGKSISSCVSAGCDTNADCNDEACGLSVYDDGCGTSYAVGCRTDADTCSSDADCTNGDVCAIEWSSGTWQCQGVGCAIGRPLLVDGALHTAKATTRSDWATDDGSLYDRAQRALRAARLDLNESELAVLRRHYTEVAAMEHASVASFARFSLELLSLGAPPDLLMASQMAAADEVVHAQIAYGLVSAISDAPVGPGPLAVDGAARTSRREILAGLIEEACIGETLGVAEALAAADSVESEELRALLTTIARDEQRHAELAWRTLSWLLEQADEDERAFARETVERSLAKYAQGPAEEQAAMPAWGILGREALTSVRQQTLRDVVKPCAEGLLARFA